MKSCIWAILGQNISPCVKLKNKLIASKMQSWDKYGIAIPIPTWRKCKKYTHSSQASLKPSSANFIRFQGMGIIPFVSVLYPSMEVLENIQSALISEQSVSSLWHLSSLTDSPPFILSLSLPVQTGSVFAGIAFSKTLLVFHEYDRYSCH